MYDTSNKLFVLLFGLNKAPIGANIKKYISQSSLIGYYQNHLAFYTEYRHDLEFIGRRPLLTFNFFCHGCCVFRPANRCSAGRP